MSARRLLGAAAALALGAAGWWYVLFWPAPAGSGAAPHLPELRVETGASGAPAARIDHAALAGACEALGLTPPPDLNGTDPVPLRAMLDRIGRWAETRKPDALGELGSVYLALALDREALECFAAAESMDPREARWAYLAAVECETLGYTDQAESRYRRCLELDPQDAAATARLAAIELERGALDEAQAAYQACVRLRPLESPGYVGLARVALARNQVGAAVELLHDAVRRSPGDFLAWRTLARACALDGRTEEARSASDRAAQLPQYLGRLAFDPRLQDAQRLARTQPFLENELQSATASGHFDRGVELAGELLARRPGDAEILARLAGCEQQLGRREQAAQSADAAAQAAPGSSAVRRMQAEIALAQARNDDAAEAAEALLRIDPGSARGHELLGRARFLQGRQDEGIGLVRRALELDPGAAEARRALVIMLQQTGRVDEAAAVMERRESDEGKGNGNGGAP